MKTQIFPNWCKKLGVLIFLVGFFTSGYQGFLEGVNEGWSSFEENVVKEIKKNDDRMLDFFDVLAIAGMMIYVLSKEKIEDDFINKLRLESFQLTALIGLLITLVLYIVSREIELTLDYFIVFFLWIYLIIFWYKKREY